MASSKPKKRSADEAFHQCTGLGVPDSSIRKIISKLQKDDAPPKSYSRSSGQRYAFIKDCIKAEKIETTSGQIELYTTDLEKYINMACNQNPLYAKCLNDLLEKELERNPEGVPGVIYLDECVPGNILCPDNKRKSYLVYFAYLPCAKLRSLHFWWPLSLLRHSEVERLSGALPEFFTRMLRKQLLDLGGILIDTTLVPTSKLYFIADEAAIKLACGSKGASGMRPCLHCDAFSKERSEMAESLGHASIACSDFSRFQPVKDEDVKEILAHLAYIRNNQSAKSFKEAMQLLGWTFNEHCCFLDDEVKRLLQPSQCHYDAMHCYWSNGQVCQECGLFFTEAVRLGGITREQLEHYMDLGWKKTTSIGGALSPGSLKQLVSPKILREGVDFKGDAGQCLDLLPLMCFFALQCLNECQALQPYIKSLVALWRVTSHILHAKNNVEEVRGLQRLQSQHLELFIQCYGTSKVRPKHHFAGHIEQQALESGVLLDCFVGERKNKCFKNVLCPMVSKLQGFEKAILQRFLETDLTNLESFTGNQVVLKQLLDTCSEDNTKMAKALSCIWGEVKAGHILLRSAQEAMQVVGCMERRGNKHYHVFLVVTLF